MIMSVTVCFIEILNAAVGDRQAIQVNNIDASDGGEYSCYVFNETGISIGTSEIFVKPYFTQDPADMTVDYLDRVELSCEAKAFPEPVEEWQFKNGDLFEYLDINGSIFVIREVVFSDSGNVYRCAATNVINGTEYTSFSTTATIIGNVCMLVTVTIP